MSDLIFSLGLSLLLTHELDAIRCREWRIFPITSRMSDSRGYHVFTALHIPLFAALLWALGGGVEGATRAAVIAGLELFFVVHVGLHIAFRRHPEYAFRGPFSWGLIVGAGACGLIDLAARWL